MTKVLRTFFVPEFLWEEYKELCGREKISMTQDLVNHITRSVETRRNTQVNLQTFMDPAATSPMKVVCNRLRGATQDGHVFCAKHSPGPVWIQGIKCYSCEKNRHPKPKKNGF